MLTVKTFTEGLELVVLAVVVTEASPHSTSVTIIAASVALKVVPGLLTKGTQHCFSSRPVGVLATSY